MSIIGTIYEDITTDVLGSIGYWQWMVTLLATVTMIPNFFNHYEDTILLKPAYGLVCVPPNRHSALINVDLCKFTINSTEVTKCDMWKVKLFWFIGIKKSWTIFCDEKLQLLSTTIISRFGKIFGSIIFGLIADSFGRKAALFIDVFCDIFFGLIIIFCTSEAWFRLLVFLKALFSSASLYIGILIISEVSSNSWRTRLTTLVAIPRLMSTIFVVPAVNGAPNLETYQFIACMFGILGVEMLRRLPESPQWMLYNRKIQHAEKLLFKAAEMNGVTLCSVFQIRPVNYRAYNVLDETTNCVGVLTTRNVRTIIAIILIFWCLHCFLWSSIYVRAFTGNYTKHYFLALAFAFVCISGCLTILLSRKLKIKRLLTVNIIMTGAVTISAMLFNKIDGLTKSMLTSVALSTGVVTYALLLNVTPRLFAINIRGTLFGFCHATGEIGTITVYLIYHSQVVDERIFVVVLIIVTFTLATLCFVLPDTDGREMPDVMEDMDYYSELSKPLRWASQKTHSPSKEEIEMRVHSFGSRRTNSTHTLGDRPPARPIGFVRLWLLLRSCLRRKPATT